VGKAVMMVRNIEITVVRRAYLPEGSTPDDALAFAIHSVNHSGQAEILTELASRKGNSCPDRPGCLPGTKMPGLSTEKLWQHGIECTQAK
jgi:hypothetical protein